MPYGNHAAVRSWFPADTACLDYLDWLRWPEGFCCPHCRASRGVHASQPQPRLDRRQRLFGALQPYPLAIADTFGHKTFNIKRSGLPAHELLPGVHRVASLLKRWLAGTHQSG